MVTDAASDFFEVNPWQEDSDGDGIGDACDPYPLDPSQPPGAMPGGQPRYIRAPYRAWIESSDHVETKLAELHVYGNASQGRLAMYRPETLRNTEYVEPFVGDGAVFTRTLQKKQYEIKDHLGNVRLVISDLKEVLTAGSQWTVDVRSVNEYYPFGMLQPGRNWQAGRYRYGFNGKEMDNEVAADGVTGESGSGAVYDYGMRVYDARIGKFLSVDPLAPDYPHWSPYAFGMNRVIDGVDLDGLEWSGTVTQYADGWQVYRLHLDLDAYNLNVDAHRFDDVLKGIERYAPGMFSTVDFIEKKIYIVESVDVRLRPVSEYDPPVKGDAHRNQFRIVGYMDPKKRKMTTGKSSVGHMVTNLIRISFGALPKAENRDLLTALHEIGHTLGIRHEDVAEAVYALMQEHGPHSSYPTIEYILDEEIDEVYVFGSDMIRVGDAAEKNGVLTGKRSEHKLEFSNEDADRMMRCDDC